MSTGATTRLQTEEFEGVVVARFVDERIVDEVVIQAVGAALADLVDKQGYSRIVLNFGGVHFMASAVVAQLFKLLKKLNAVGGTLKFCAIRTDLMPVFKITGLDKMVQILPEEQAAIDACG